MLVCVMTPCKSVLQRQCKVHIAGGLEASRRQGLGPADRRARGRQAAGLKISKQEGLEQTEGGLAAIKQKGLRRGAGFKISKQEGLEQTEGGLGAIKQEGLRQASRRASGRQAHLASGCPTLHDVWILLQQSITLKLSQAADMAIQCLQQMLLSPFHLNTHWHDYCNCPEPSILNPKYLQTACCIGLMATPQQAQSFNA